MRKTCVLSLLSLVMLIHMGSKAQSNQNRRPNFIIIYTDDQREDALGANGNQRIMTPALDRMASKAIRFTNAQVVFALCSPSRAALLTGRYGSANGVLGLGSALKEGEKTLASYLKDAGYHTAVSGKWHIDQHPKEVGFDFYSFFESNGAYYKRLIHDMERDVRPAQHCDEYCVDRSIDFLKDVVSKQEPFFLFHCTQLPHMNGELKWDAKTETLAGYNVDDMPVAENRLDDLSGKPDYLKTVRNRTQAKNYGYPEADAIRSHTREYYSVITEMDDALGRLFKAIEDLGLLENTYIIFMSDNGWMLGEHGFTSKVLPYSPSTRVPMFVLGPDLRPRTERSLVLNIDVAPTILDMAGLPVPQQIHGERLTSVLKGGAGPRDSFVYEGLGDYGGTKPNLAVVSERYRYIETYEDESLEKVLYKELYDLRSDPGEVNNLLVNEPVTANKHPNRKKREVISQFESAIRQHKESILKKG